MKLNFVLPGLGDSGGIKVVKKYAQLLNEKGIDTKIYCSYISPNSHRYKSELVNLIHKDYCTVKTILTHKTEKNIIWVKDIEDKYVRPADITIATSWPTSYQVNKLTSCCNKAYFIQDFEIWDNEKLGKESYKLPLEHIVIAKWIDDILVNELGCKPAYLVHNGMDTDFFHPNKELKDLRDRDRNIQCLMLYHELPKKGIDDGIEAYKLAKNTFPNLRLIMFGMFSKPKFDCVDEYYQNPSQEKLRELYQSSDIFIYPSREEGWGLTPIEAMACGCPVVGTNTGCMTEIGQDGENVLLSKPCDAKALGSNIIRLSNDEALRNELSVMGRRTAETLSWERSSNKLMNILKAIGSLNE
jgi:glycosyltransferase involved in cell wall biosynthesis